MAHARKAIAAGADGLVLLSAGAGGQTGWLNGMAFVRALRQEYDGPLVLAGGISDGVALRAAQVLGCDLAYMGTRFIATRESLAPDAYRDMLVDASIDDVLLTRAFTGLPTSMLLPAIQRAGLDPGHAGRDGDPQHGGADCSAAQAMATRPTAPSAGATSGAPATASAGCSRCRRWRPCWPRSSKSSTRPAADPRPKAARHSRLCGGQVVAKLRPLCGDTAPPHV